MLHGSQAYGTSSSVIFAKSLGITSLTYYNKGPSVVWLSFGVPAVVGEGLAVLPGEKGTIAIDSCTYGQAFGFKVMPDVYAISNVANSLAYIRF